MLSGALLVHSGCESTDSEDSAVCSDETCTASSTCSAGECTTQTVCTDATCTTTSACTDTTCSNSETGTTLTQTGQTSTDDTASVTSTVSGTSDSSTSTDTSDTQTQTDNACLPGERFCQENGVFQCLADGITTALIQKCSAAQSCDPAGAVCRTRICKPGAAACDGQISTLCNALGTGYEPGGTDCNALGLFCTPDGCLETLCEPSTEFCLDNDLFVCADDGRSAIIALDCLDGQTCDLPTRSCVAQICSPHEAVCNGPLATTCNDAGTGVDPGGIDCSAAGEVCADGTCKTQVCTPGGLFCAEDGVYACNAQGTQSTLVTACTTAQACDPNTLSCVAQACVPYEPVCNNTTATTCNASGTGVVPGGVNCDATGKVCVDGSCLPKVCAPASVFCGPAGVFSCNAQGTVATLVTACGAGKSCDPSTLSCVAQVCIPNGGMCVGEVATYCKADGSGPLAGGTDCTTLGKKCAQGTCTSTVCSPNATFCKSDGVYTCNAQGSAATLVSACTAGQTCDPTTLSCVGQSCVPGAGLCIGTVATTCNQAGTGPNAGGFNCATESKVCVDGACIEAQVDPILPTMITIPTGSFPMGSGASETGALTNEKPAHTKLVQGFTIDQTEVTVEAYERCVQAGYCAPTNTQTGNNGACNYGVAGRAKHPMNCVDVGNAAAYCSWVNKRLPDEWEWEFAARGVSGAKYPWGSSTPSCILAVMGENGSGCGQDTTWPVGSKSAGDTPTGLKDMAGNVWEWVASCYYAYPSGTPDCTKRVFRGGGLYNSSNDIRGAQRGVSGANLRFDDVGFRCAK